MKRITLLICVLMINILAFAGLKPSKEYAITPDDYAMNYEEVILKTDDDYNLNAWFFKPADESSKKYIIISHDGEGNMADDIEIVAQFLSLGYHVLIYDYRGYGQSDDFKINEKFFIYPHFVKDLQAAIEYMRKYHDRTFDLYGQGIGAGLSLSVGANRPEVRRVIADAPYVSFEQQKKRLEDKKGETVVMPLVYDKMMMEPLYALEGKGNHLYGVLMIVGENDEVVNEDDVKPVSKLKNIKGKAEIHEVEGATNDDLFSANKNAYFERIKEFLESH